jgi:hypothetical protein
MGTLYHKAGTQVTFGSDGSVVTRSGPQVHRHTFPTFITAIDDRGEAQSFYVDSPEDFERFLVNRGYASVSL